MDDERHNPYGSEIFNIPPRFDTLDFRGGILGKKADSTLEGKIPAEMQCEFYEFLTVLGRALGYTRPEEDAATHIKRTVEEYCRTYQERLDRALL